MFFLLDREPPTAILPAFNLKEIASYFPEYEETVVQRIRRGTP
jgi:hypothetical protein